MSPNDPHDEEDDLPPEPPEPVEPLFPFDEMSTGEASSLLRRANVITGAPPAANAQPDPALKPMTGAQLAFRPSAPPRAQKPGTGTQPAFKPATGTHAAFKPGTGTQPAFKPATGTQPAFKPSTGTQPAFKPISSGTSGKHPAVSRSSTGTNTFATFKPSVETEPIEDEDVPPVFDPERLQAQIRAMSLTDSALGRVMKPQKQTKAPTSSADDTFVKTKMKQAEAKVPDFDLDEDLG
jgi:hypothetical protein